MVEPIAVALHAINLTQISVYDTAVVGGTGVIALFVIRLLKLAACGQIINFDLDQGRMDLALKPGATHAFKVDAMNVP